VLLPDAPLNLLGAKPIVETVRFPASDGGLLEADLYRPAGEGRHGAVLIVIGAAPRARYDPRAVRLAAGVYPSARFGANAAWLRLLSLPLRQAQGKLRACRRVLTFNLLELLKAAALDVQCRNARPKRLRFAIFSQFGRVVHHARGQLVRLANLVWETLVIPGRRRLRASVWPAC